MHFFFIQNNMNHTFLGDWDIRYLVKMLDGTVFEVVYNEWMEDDEMGETGKVGKVGKVEKVQKTLKEEDRTPQHSLLQQVVRQAEQHGIRLRCHRVKLHVDEDEKMIFLLQEPPRHGWRKICTEDIVEIHIQSDIDRLDALDTFETSETSEDLVEKSIRFLSLDVSYQVREEVNSLWERMACHYHPQTLHLGTGSIQAIRAFGEKGVRRLHLSQRYDFNKHTVDLICDAMPHLEELTVTVRIVPDASWGSHLYHRTHVRLVRWRILGYQDVQRSREMAQKAGWTDWHFQVHVDNPDVIEIEWTRFHLHVYGLVIPLSETEEKE